MSKSRLKHLMQAKGVNVYPIYKLTAEGAKVSPNSSVEGVMHYRAEPKKKPLL